MNAAPQSEAVDTRRFLKNSMANILTGSSSALLNILIPSVLARHLPTTEFSAWSLILQLASYTAILNLGMQIAVGRYVAIAHEKKDIDYQNKIISTAFFILCASTLVAILGIASISIGIHWLFPDIPGELITQTRISLLLVGGALAVGLPFMALNGFFVGHQRNEIVAAITGPTRLVLGIALALLAVMASNILAMAAAFVVVYLISYAASWITIKRIDRGVRITFSNFNGDILRELAVYCSGVVVWSISMLMVNGLDTAIVGRLDFLAVAGYSASIGLITFIAGAQSALFSPMLQIGATLAARGSHKELGALLIRSTRWSLLILLCASAPILLFARELLRIWLGQKYSDQMSIVISILILGNVVRLSATPYSLLLLATAQHRRIYFSPLLEGVTNLLVTILAGLKFGVVGVAYGMLVGAVVGQLMNYFYNIPRSSVSIEVDRRKLLLKSIVPPIICFAPIVAVWELMPWHENVSVSLKFFALLIFLILSMRYALDDVDRKGLLGLFQRFSHKKKQPLQD